MTDHPFRERYLSTTQVAEKLGKAKDYVDHYWPTWVSRGVIPLRLPNRRGDVHNKCRLLFKESEIDRMLESLRVAQ